MEQRQENMGKFKKIKNASGLFNVGVFFVTSESDIIHSNDKVSDSLLATQDNWGF